MARTDIYGSHIYGNPPTDGARTSSLPSHIDEMSRIPVFNPANAAVQVWELQNGFLVQLPDRNISYAKDLADMAMLITNYYGKLQMGLDNNEGPQISVSRY